MNEKMRVNLAELLPIIDEQLQAGKEVCFSPNGISMLPMLRPARDSVILKAAGQRLKKYDLPMYRRDDGQFVLHRVVKIEKDGTYTMCGDNQYAREKGIKKHQIIGIVSGFYRDEQYISCNHILYKIYCILRVKERYFYGFSKHILNKLVRLLNGK